MSLQYVFDIGTIIFRILLVVSGLFCIDKILYIVAAFLPGKKFPKAAKNYKYAILIPARNESKVVESLLKSIDAQTYPRELVEVFVVVEDENDPTIEICKKFGAHSTVRKHLELKGKGYAMDELMTDMYEKGYKGKFDAYFIFDADNYLSPTYLEEMNKVYSAGYDIGIGYRNSKNWNDGCVAACSALTFSIVNTFHNKLNCRMNRTMMISGTGFFINAKILDDLGGWKFYCLTEDLELSNFAALNNFKSTYCEAAEFYDEQPSKFRVSIKQRTRWLKGYFQAAKIYNRRIVKSIFTEKGNRFRKLSHLMFIVPVIVLAVVVGVYALFSIGLGIYAAIMKDALFKNFLLTGGIMLGIIYFSLFLFNFLCLMADLKRIDINLWTSIKTILFGPIFLFWYAPIFFKAYFKREIKWEAIEHKVAFTLPDNKQDDKK